MEGRRILKRPDKLDRFAEGNEALKQALKEQIESEGLEWNEEDWKDYTKRALDDRSKTEVSQVLRKQGESFAKKVTDWASENLSERQWSLLSADERAIAYIKAGAEVSSEEVARLFDPRTGSLKPFVKDIFDEPLRAPVVDEEGVLRETPRKKKAEATPVKLPTEKELAKMDSEQIAKFLKVTTPDNW